MARERRNEEKSFVPRETVEQILEFARGLRGVLGDEPLLGMSAVREEAALNGVLDGDVPGTHERLLPARSLTSRETAAVQAMLRGITSLEFRAMDALLAVSDPHAKTRKALVQRMRELAGELEIRADEVVGTGATEAEDEVRSPELRQRLS